MRSVSLWPHPDSYQTYFEPRTRIWRESATHVRAGRIEQTGKQSDKRKVCLASFLTYAAGIPPAATGVLRILGWFPLPSPVEGHTVTSTSGEVANQLDVGVLM